MPIEHIPVARIDQSTFKDIDYVIMGLAYETQNEIGRHFDETIFKNCLFEKMREKGLKIDTESPIRLTHKSYTKTFYVDLIVNRSVPYEFKAVKDFHPRHDAQLLQYLHLMELHHGKLINSNSKSVKGRFVSTHITQAVRKQFHIDDTEMDQSAECSDLLNSFSGLLSDWGTSLEISTYNDALPAILPTTRKGTVDIHFHNKKVGSLEIMLVPPCSGLILTSFSHDALGYRKHLSNILSLSSLERIHWINMNKQNIHATTLQTS